jgi:hypothetical protein
MFNTIKVSYHTSRLLTYLWHVNITILQTIKEANIISYTTTKPLTLDSHFTKISSHYQFLIHNAMTWKRDRNEQNFGQNNNSSLDLQQIQHSFGHCPASWVLCNTMFQKLDMFLSEGASGKGSYTIRVITKGQSWSLHLKLGFSDSPTWAGTTPA